MRWRSSTCVLSLMSRWRAHSEWVFSITGHHRAVDLLCLTETWQDADCAVLSCLRGAAYNVVDHARRRTADDLWVNHGSVATVAGAQYRVVADRHCWSADHFWDRLRTCPCRLFRCDRRPAVPVRLTAAAAAADVHWWTDARALNLTLRLCIVSYRIMHHIVSYRDILCEIDRIVSFSLRAISCQHYYWVTICPEKNIATEYCKT